MSPPNLYRSGLARWGVVALLGLALASAGCPTTKAKTMQSQENDLRRTLLDTLLRQADIRGKAFSEALLTHGSIVPEEVPYLAKTASEGSSDARRNASYLIGRARTPESEAALRTLVQKTQDARVLALALDALRSVPDFKTLAATRQALLQEALRNPDGIVQAAAVRAGWRAGIPNFTAELEKRLDAPEQEVRDAVTALLAETGAGLLEPKVRQLLIHPPGDKRYSLADLYQALAYSNDPLVADDLRQSLAGASSQRETDFLNGLTLSKQRKPWSKQLLLGLAQQEGRIKWSAFDSLAAWGTAAPEQELLRICITELERKLPKERTGKSLYDIERESCRNYLGVLAGKPFAWTELHQGLAFARQRLEGSAQAK